jgi:hypothetical protein
LLSQPRCFAELAIEAEEAGRGVLSMRYTVARCRIDAIAET